MNLIQHILTHNDCYKNGVKITPRGITVHSTGANNPNINRYVPLEGTKYSSNHWDKSGIAKCVHAFIGKLPDGTIATCQTLPFDMKGWHAGKPWKKGLVGANNTHIGFEVCEDDLQDTDYFNKIWEEATDFCAYLCSEFKLDPLADGVIISHHEAHLRGIGSNHADIDHWLKVHDTNMDNFRACVAEKLKGGSDVMTQDEFDVKLQSALNKRNLQPYSNWAVDEEVLMRISRQGLSDGSRPQAFATREEMFAMMLRLENYILELFGKEKQ